MKFTRASDKLIWSWWCKESGEVRTESREPRHLNEIKSLPLDNGRDFCIITVSSFVL